jgi:hypothetical protein
MKFPLKIAPRAAVPAKPTIDYPHQDEKIASRHYTIRVNAPISCDTVDVSIDQGPWLACRDSVGYWWYDWSDFDSGPHEVIARARAQKGKWALSAPVEFIVV